MEVGRHSARRSKGQRSALSQSKTSMVHALLGFGRWVRCTHLAGGCKDGWLLADGFIEASMVCAQLCIHARYISSCRAAVLAGTADAQGRGPTTYLSALQSASRLLTTCSHSTGMGAIRHCLGGHCLGGQASNVLAVQATVKIAQAQGACAVVGN